MRCNASGDIIIAVGDDVVPYCDAMPQLILFGISFVIAVCIVIAVDSSTSLGHCAWFSHQNCVLVAANEIQFLIDMP